MRFFEGNSQLTPPDRESVRGLAEEMRAKAEQSSTISDEMRQRIAEKAAQYEREMAEEGRDQGRTR
jgi:hypothetical protein